MADSMALIRELRERTSCGVKDCKDALADSGNDIEKAIEYLRKKGLATAAKKSGRGTNAGIIFSYIHAGGQIGVMLELNCETDFVANTDEFQQLGKDLCMQVCAMSPVAVKRDDISKETIEKEKAIYEEQIPADKKAQARAKIVEGKLEKFFKDSCLLEQPFVKDESKTVEAVIQEKIGTIKENIAVRRFVRFQLGEK